MEDVVSEQKKSSKLPKGHVWRVETKGGLGMYSGECGFYPVTGGHRSERQPSPDKDEKLVKSLMEYYDGKRLESNRRRKRYGFNRPYSGLYFGFASLKQFRQWVHRAEWRRGLNKNGYRLVKYEADTMFVGDTQAVFDKEHSRVVEVRRVDFRDVDGSDLTTNG